MENRTHLLDFFKLKTPHTRSPLHIVEQSFYIQRQMPEVQIAHFIEQAEEKQHDLMIQTNPTETYGFYSEFEGRVIKFLEDRRLLIQSPDSQLTFIVSLDNIRHIRTLSRA